MWRRISDLESKVEALVEGAFARLFGGRLQVQDVAVQLARALEDHSEADLPATRFVVYLHPDDAQALLGDQPRAAEALTGELVALAREANITLPRVPEVVILPSVQTAPRKVTVTVERDGAADSTFTQGMAPPAPGELPAPPPAFLILVGDRTVPLGQPVVSVGRRADNHIILDDARVSRAHAQLRLRFGRYVVYDLGSTGGTFVNDRRVQECVLRPGDVISLAGVAIIYGEEEADKAPEPSPGAGSTQPGGPLPPPDPDPAVP